MILQILIFAALAILAGLALTFTGYALFRLLLPLWGFFVGLWLGGSMIAAVFGGGFMATALGVISGVVVGIIFAVLSYAVFSLAVLIFGAALGFALGEGLMILFGFKGELIIWIIGLIMAFVFALMFMQFRLPQGIVIVLTAFAGSSAVIAGVLALFGQVPPSQLGLALTQATINSSWFWWIVWFVLAMFGMMAQAVLVQVAALSDKYAYDAFMEEQEEKAKA